LVSSRAGHTAAGIQAAAAAQASAPLVECECPSTEPSPKSLSICRSDSSNNPDQFSGTVRCDSAHKSLLCDSTALADGCG